MGCRTCPTSSARRSRTTTCQLPFFDGADAPLWHTALGYEIAGILGILLVGLVLWGIGSVLLRPDPVATSSGSLAT